jgi:hypothetical protein
MDGLRLLLGARTQPRQRDEHRADGEQGQEAQRQAVEVGAEQVTRTPVWGSVLAG